MLFNHLGSMDLGDLFANDIGNDDQPVDDNGMPFRLSVFGRDPGVRVVYLRNVETETLPARSEGETSSAAESAAQEDTHDFHHKRAKVHSDFE